MLLREKDLRRRKYTLGFVRSAESRCITIAPNTTVTIAGYVDKGIEYQPTTAVLQSTEESVSHNLDICPSLITYSGPSKGFIDVTISNITTDTVKVPSKSLVAEIQPVTVDSSDKGNGDTGFTFIDDIQLSDDIEPQQAGDLKDLIFKYKDVFSQSDTDNW